jgi:excisionase family DNA binding protein
MTRLLWTPRQAAKELAVSERTLWDRTVPRGTIPVVKIGRSVRYDPQDLQHWIDEKKERGDTP